MFTKTRLFDSGQSGNPDQFDSLSLFEFFPNNSAAFSKSVRDFCGLVVEVVLCHWRHDGVSDCVPMIQFVSNEMLKLLMFFSECVVFGFERDLMVMFF